MARFTETFSPTPTTQRLLCGVEAGASAKSMASNIAVPVEEELYTLDNIPVPIRVRLMRLQLFG